MKKNEAVLSEKQVFTNTLNTLENITSTVESDNLDHFFVSQKEA